MTKIRKKFGKKVKELRAKLGITQEQLGEKANLHYNYIGNIETGRQNPTLETIEKIAKAFEISVSDLLEGV